MQKNIQKLWELKNLIESSQKILLVNHIRMDGDALGSLGWLYLLLKKLWKKVYAINDEPIPEAFHFLWNTEIIKPEMETEEKEWDLIISLDAASWSQLWDVYKEFFAIFDTHPFVVIDHHITNNWFWTLNIIDPQYSSTCELVFDIISELWYSEQIDSEIATYLLMWINTDTNIFYNSNTTYNTFKVASELFRLWGNQRQITNELFKKKGLAQAKLWWEALSHIESHFEWQVVWSYITQEIFEKTETDNHHTSGLLNEFLANIDWAKISYLLYELPDWSIKWSLRSFKKIHNVSQIAQIFWGWGHIQAAGFTRTWVNIQQAQQELLDEIQKYL